MERVKTQSKLVMFFKALLGNESQDFEELNAEEKKELEAIRKLNSNESTTNPFKDRYKPKSKNKMKLNGKDIEQNSGERTRE